MGLIKRFYNNARKPEGKTGLFMANLMNKGTHKRLSEWSFGFLGLGKYDEPLDIGCGGGGNIGRMLDECSEGRVTGADYSEVSVSRSLALNSKAVRRPMQCHKSGGRLSSVR